MGTVHSRMNEVEGLFYSTVLLHIIKGVNRTGGLREAGGEKPGWWGHYPFCLKMVLLLCKRQMGKKLLATHYTDHWTRDAPKMFHGTEAERAEEY